jgi:hypothetical protein
MGETAQAKIMIVQVLGLPERKSTAMSISYFRTKVERSALHFAYLLWAYTVVEFECDRQKATRLCS